MDQPDTDPVDVVYISEQTGYSKVSVYRWHHAGMLPEPARTRPLGWQRATIDWWVRQNLSLIHISEPTRPY